MQSAEYCCICCIAITFILYSIMCDYNFYYSKQEKWEIEKERERTKIKWKKCSTTQKFFMVCLFLSIHFLFRLFFICTFWFFYLLFFLFNSERNQDQEKKRHILCDFIAFTLFVWASLRRGAVRCDAVQSKQLNASFIALHYIMTKAFM